MEIFVAKLLDTKHVKISNFHPHQSGHPAIGQLNQSFPKELVNLAVTTSIVAQVDQSTTQISGFIGRLDFCPKRLD